MILFKIQLTNYCKLSIKQNKILCQISIIQSKQKRIHIHSVQREIEAKFQYFYNNEISKASSNKSGRQSQGQEFKYGQIKSIVLTAKSIFPSNQQQITKSSNYDTNINISYDYEAQSENNENNRLEQIQYNQKQQFGVVNYKRVSLQEIKHEYHRLRQQVISLNQEIRRRQQLSKSRVKKPVKTIAAMNNQNRIAQLQKDIFQNNFLLGKLRPEYEQLQKRSNLTNSSVSRPNADIKEKALYFKQRIITLKEKIKLLKRKTKKTGNDIVNGRDFREVMQRLQRQQGSCLAKHASLQGKLQESVCRLQRQEQKLNEIQYTYAQAEDYLRLFRLENQEEVQKNGLVSHIRQKQSHQQIISRKIQSDQQTFLQKYHQLLKQFELQTEKLFKIDQKLVEVDVKTLYSQNVILDLQQQQDHLEKVIQSLNEQQKLKKQAQYLRQLILKQSRQEQTTFMTGQGFDSTSNHMVGVKSIIQETESELKQTIQLNDEKQTIQKSDKVRTQDKLLFTKIQQSHYEVSKSIATKHLGKQPSNLTGKQKYYLFAKQKTKMNQQQGNLTSSRKISSINEDRSVRRVSSVVKSNQNTKLKQLAINRTANNSINIAKLFPHANNANFTAPDKQKKPYMNFNKSLHQQQIQKGKQSLRQRKNSFKIVTLNQNKEEAAKKDFMYQLYQVNKHVEGYENQNKQQLYLNQTRMNLKVERDLIQQLRKTKSLYNKNNIVDSIKVTHFTRQLKGSQGNKISQASKSAKIKYQQVNPRNAQVMMQIDRQNVEYNRKIEQLKKQITNKQINYCSEVKRTNIQHINQQISERNDQLTNPNANTNSLQDLEMKKDMIPAQMFTIDSKKQIQKHLESVGAITLTNNQPQKSEDDPEDDDNIEQDISEINKMVRKRLQNQAIKVQ